MNTYNYIVSILDAIKEEFVYKTSEFVFSSELYNWKWFLSAFSVAFIVYIIKLKSIHKILTRTFSFLKNKRYQKEFIKDVQFFFFKIIYKPLLLVFLGYSSNNIFEGTKKLYASWNLTPPFIIHLDSLHGPFFKILLVLLCYDFAYYIVHYTQHHFTPFWVFHKTHHRSTALNPLTRQRSHPVGFFANMFILHSIAAIFVSIITSIYLIPDDKPFYFYMIIFLCVKNGLDHLRHSHIKIHYGFLSYIFLSPAMHQVHHSVLKKHYGKNLSTIFSFWDLIFGTFYLPKKNEHFKLGVPDFRNKIPTLKEELILPFKELYHHYSSQKNYRKRSLVVNLNKKNQPILKIQSKSCSTENQI